MRKSIKPKLHILLLLLLALICLGACGKGQSAKEDPLAIKGFAIGDCVGQVETAQEGGTTKYVIVITMPSDADFTHCVANIELAEGASISKDSPCYIADLGGRPVLNLTLQDRDLIIVNGSDTRAYVFRIELLK